MSNIGYGSSLEVGTDVGVDLRHGTPVHKGVIITCLTFTTVIIFYEMSPGIVENFCHKSPLPDSIEPEGIQNFQYSF